MGKTFQKVFVSNTGRMSITLDKVGDLNVTLYASTVGSKRISLGTLNLRSRNPAAPSDAANSGANQWELIIPLIAVIAVALVLVTVWRVQVSQLKHPRVSQKFVTLNTVYESQVAETQQAVDEPFAQPDNGMQQSENVD